MKFTKYISWLIALSLLLAMAGCAAGDETLPATTEPSTEPTQQTTEAPTEATEPDLSSDTTHKYLSDDPVLIARRESTEAYMRKICGIIWRCEEDLLYTLTSDITPDQSSGSARLQLKAGRLYQGVPYSFGGASLAGFLDYLSEPDANGVYTFSGIDWQLMSGGSSKTAQIGTDCYGAITKAWGQVNASIEPCAIRYMVPDKGYLRVGEYTSGETENLSTGRVCAENGREKMYEAYAQLQAGDSVVYRFPDSSHSMFVTQVRVVRDAAGVIDPYKSEVTILEQTRTNFLHLKKHLDETLGENVYDISSIDKKVSFTSLYSGGYLPITCKELNDPTPIADPEITDSQTEHTVDNICTGVLSCNWYMDNVFITITDQNGAVVQQLTMNARRGGMKEIDLQQFPAEYPLRLHGSLDPNALASGEYRCTLTVRLGTEEEVTVRDFSFTR